MFMVFVVYFSNQAQISVLSGEFDIAERPVCDIGGWNAVVDVIVCIYDQLAYFWNMMTVSSTYAIITTLLLIPLVAGLFWVILSLIRGGA